MERERLLIIEDDADLYALLKYNLEKEGFKVNYATDGSVALRLFNSNY